MTVKDLKAAIANLPDTHQVILSRDAEGNGFSPASDHECAEYYPESEYFGYVSCADEGEINENCVILWPTN